MNSKLVVGLVGGVAIALAGSAIAYRIMDDSDQFAKVVSVTPATETVIVPRETCRDEPVTRHYKEAGSNIAGTAIGAVIGGVVGNQVGSGSGRKVATAAGAVAGGVIGNRVQERNRPSRSVTTTRTHCETVNDSVEQSVGYDVVYDYRGERGAVRLDHDPGERLRMVSSSRPEAEGDGLHQ